VIGDQFTVSHPTNIPHPPQPPARGSWTRRVSTTNGAADAASRTCLWLIEINIQIRAIEAIAAIGTGDLAVLLVHFASATVAEVDLFLQNFLVLGLGWRFIHRRSI
jgi:hypothetical protein